MRTYLARRKLCVVVILTAIASAAWNPSAEAGVVSATTGTTMDHPEAVDEGDSGEVDIHVQNTLTLNKPNGNPVGIPINLTDAIILSLTFHGIDTSDKPTNLKLFGAHLGLTNPLIDLYTFNPALGIGYNLGTDPFVLTFDSDKDLGELDRDHGLWDVTIEIDYSYTDLLGVPRSGSVNADAWIQINDLPEPSTLCLLGTGAVGLIGLRRRRAHQGKPSVGRLT